MKFIVTAAAAVALAMAPTSAQAALSGFYDSAEKIAAILGSGAVANALHQAPIWLIENTGTRHDGAHEWTVRVQECDLKVYLIAQPPAGAGKTTYTVEAPGACQ
jgi:hypothetical protein